MNIFKKYKSQIIFFIGLISYIYLLNKIFNNKFDLILFYFSALIISYLFIKIDSYLLCVLIIIFDFIKSKVLRLRENNQNNITENAIAESIKDYNNQPSFELNEYSEDTSEVEKVQEKTEKDNGDTEVDIDMDPDNADNFEEVMLE